MSEEMLSPEEIDALLAGHPDEDDRTHGFTQHEIDAMLNGEDIDMNIPSKIKERHNKVQDYIKECKQQILNVMNAVGEDQHQLLQTIQSSDDNLSAQRLLGKYYTFLNECYAEFNRLTDLSQSETNIYHHSIKLHRKK